jgi:hypothetical protein
MISVCKYQLLLEETSHKANERWASMAYFAKIYHRNAETPRSYNQPSACQIHVLQINRRAISSMMMI